MSSKLNYSSGKKFDNDIFINDRFDKFNDQNKFNKLSEGFSQKCSKSPIIGWVEIYEISNQSC